MTVGPFEPRRRLSLQRARNKLIAADGHVAREVRVPLQPRGDGDDNAIAIWELESELFSDRGPHGDWEEFVVAAAQVALQHGL